MLSHQSERRNYRAFLWHAAWLALATTFTDINTVMPGLLVQAGGTEFHVGLLTGIMIGVPLVAQLLFAGFLSTRALKRPFLLLGINVRIVALAGVALTLAIAPQLGALGLILLVYLWMLLFSASGAFAGVSYTDILGKSITTEDRRRFFVARQYISSFGILLSAFVARWVLGFYSYPTTYLILFAAAAVTLLVASGGFWQIREKPTPTQDSERGIVAVLRKLPSMIRADRNLQSYIVMSNLSGFGTALLPFLVVLAQRRMGLSGTEIGTFLLVQIVGMLVSNLVWQRVITVAAFRGVLLAATVIGALVPVAALVLVGVGSPWLYSIVFLLSGASISARRIGQDGAVVQMSTDQNRALYTGAIGTLNLTIAFFPLMVGLLIEYLGYWPVFVFAAVAMAASGFFVRRLHCEIA
jgi:MFS family permease